VREGLGARQVAPGTIGQVSGQEQGRIPELPWVGFSVICQSKIVVVR
jgi:hypothetical protein